MSCERACEQLSAYQLGELSAADGEVIERHLDGCEACAEELAGIAEVAELLGELSYEEAPPELLGTIERQLSLRHYVERAWRAGLAALVMAAAFVLWLTCVREPGVRLVAANEAYPEERVARMIHEQRLDGTLRLEVQSADVAELSELARSHIGMAPQLAQQPEDTAARIQIMGASYIAERQGLLVALVIDGQPVSLWVGPRGEGAPSEGVIDKEIHFRREGALKTLSWTRNNRSYVLVSALPGVGQTACLSCHTSPERRARIADLGLVH